MKPVTPRIPRRIVLINPRVLGLVCLALGLAGLPGFVPKAGAQPVAPIQYMLAQPIEPGYEAHYQERQDSLHTQRVFTPTSGNAGVDEGKQTWPRLLANLYRLRNDSQAQATLIATTGDALQRSQWAGTFCGTFSVPGYTQYCQTFWNQLPGAQQARAIAHLNDTTRYPRRCPPSTGWQLISRPDHFMDAVYAYSPQSLPNGTEFNSENYHWMQRMSGYLWAQRLEDTARMRQTYRPFVRNLVRTILSRGRLEWNSNNYWGHTFNPLVMLYQHTQDSADRAAARAVLDWMTLELALHYLDGASVAGADARAKSSAYRPMSGSTALFNYLFFAHPGQMPSRGGVFRHSSIGPFEDAVGYLSYSDYRPPQQILDIAWRRFSTPVEIRAAKPYYAVDHDGYSHWADPADRKSRRFEYETLYLERDYTLSSCMAGRPDGRIGDFSEQSLWRLAVRGGAGGRGPVQMMGGAGPMDQPAGRWPFEQMAQLRSSLMRVAKNTSRLWVGLPASGLTTSQIGDTLLVDMGAGVFAALKPWQGTFAGTRPQPGDATYLQHAWTYDSTGLAALVLEVGTLAEHGSWSGFVTAVTGGAARLWVDSTDRINYRSSRAHTLTLAYQPLAPYQLEAPTAVRSVVDPGGVLPRVWYDGVPARLHEWGVWQVSHGERIVDQPWGSLHLDLRLQGEGLRISARPSDGVVEYGVYPAPPEVASASSGDHGTDGHSRRRLSKSEARAWPNPAPNGAAVMLSLTGVTEATPGHWIVRDLAGRQVALLAGLANRPTQWATGERARAGGVYVAQWYPAGGRAGATPPPVRVHLGAAAH